MAIQYPTALDDFSNPTATTAMDQAGYEHDVQHSNLNDVVEALERKVGIDGSTDPDSLEYRVTQLEQNSGSDSGDSGDVGDFVQRSGDTMTGQLLMANDSKIRFEASEEDQPPCEISLDDNGEPVLLIYNRPLATSEGIWVGYTSPNAVKLTASSGTLGIHGSALLTKDDLPTLTFASIDWGTVASISFNGDNSGVLQVQANAIYISSGAATVQCDDNVLVSGGDFIVNSYATFNDLVTFLSVDVQYATFNDLVTFLSVDVQFAEGSRAKFYKSNDLAWIGVGYDDATNFLKIGGSVLFEKADNINLQLKSTDWGSSGVINFMGDDSGVLTLSANSIQIGTHLLVSDYVFIDGLALVEGDLTFSDVTTQGLVLKNLTTTERDALASVDPGALIFNTTTNALEVHRASDWLSIDGVAGSNTHVQYNNAGAPGASSKFTWVNSTSTLGIGDSDGRLSFLGSGAAIWWGTNPLSTFDGINFLVKDAGADDLEAWSIHHGGDGSFYSTSSCTIGNEDYPISNGYFTTLSIGGGGTFGVLSLDGTSIHSASDFEAVGNIRARGSALQVASTDWPGLDEYVSIVWNAWVEDGRMCASIRNGNLELYDGGEENGPMIYLFSQEGTNFKGIEWYWLARMWRLGCDDLSDTLIWTNGADEVLLSLSQSNEFNVYATAGFWTSVYFDVDITANANVNVGGYISADEVIVDSVKVGNGFKIETSKVQTTNATQTTIYSYTFPSDGIYTFLFTTAATRVNAIRGASYMRKVTYRVFGGTAIIVGALQTIGTDVEDAAASGWDATVDVSVSTIRVRGTGEASTTINWITSAQITYSNDVA